MRLHIVLHFNEYLKYRVRNDNLFNAKNRKKWKSAVMICKKDALIIEMRFSEKWPVSSWYQHATGFVGKLMTKTRFWITTWEISIHLMMLSNRTILWCFPAHFYRFYYIGRLIVWREFGASVFLYLTIFAPLNRVVLQYSTMIYYRNVFSFYSLFFLVLLLVLLCRPWFCSVGTPKKIYFQKRYFHCRIRRQWNENKAWFIRIKTRRHNGLSAINYWI